MPNDEDNQGVFLVVNGLYIAILLCVHYGWFIFHQLRNWQNSTPQNSLGETINPTKSFHYTKPCIMILYISKRRLCTMAYIKSWQ